MKKNKGFTLVELLAVIVVLALIMIIAIPTILNIMENARKQSFYLYANSVYQKAMNKYVNDVSTKGGLDCSVFTLPKDLDISNGGDYQGWVKVQRVPAASGNIKFEETISSSTGLMAIKYCTSAKSSCNPEINADDDSTYQSNTWDPGEDKDGNPNTQTRLVQTAPAGYTLCYNYKSPNASGVLVKSENKCIQGTALSGDTYDYLVTLTMKDKSRAVENLVMKDAEVDQEFKETFYNALDAYAERHKTEMDKIPITELTCSGTGNVISDPGTDPNKTVTVTTTETTTTEVHYTVATTTERSTTSAEIRTTDAVDDSILLRSLTVAGYNINYTPTQLSYSITVPYNTEALSISYQTGDANSQVQLLGADSINVGNNTVTVHVYNQVTSKEIDYHIYVMRLGDPSQSPDDPNITNPVWDPSSGLPDPTLSSSNSKLSNIAISRYQLADVFSPDTFNYDIEVDEDTKVLTMSPIPQSTEAQVSVNGNENLGEGSKIRIVVRSGNGYYTSVYEITVHVKQKTKTSTVVLRTVAVGLAVVLAALAFIMRKQKKAQDLINNNNNQGGQINQGGYVQPTQVNNNNNQGNV